MDPSDENEEAWLYGEDAEDSAGETTTEAASLVVPSSADAPDEEMPLMLPTVKAFQDEDTSDSPSDVKHEVIDPRFPTTISSSRVEADDEDLDVKEPEQLSAPPDVPEDEEAVPESQPESRITEATVTEEDISSDSDDDNINVTIDAGKVASLPTTPFHKGFAIDNKSTAASFPAPLTKGIMSIPTTSAGILCPPKITSAHVSYHVLTSLTPQGNGCGMFMSSAHTQKPWGLKVAGPQMSGTDAFVGPLMLEAEAFVGPLMLETEAFVGPLMSGVEAFVGPLMLEAEGFVGPLMLETEAFVGPLMSGTDAFGIIMEESNRWTEAEALMGCLMFLTEDFVGPLVLETEAFVGPLMSGTDAFVGPLMLEMEAFVGPLMLETEDFVGPLMLEAEDFKKIAAIEEALKEANMKDKIDAINKALHRLIKAIKDAINGGNMKDMIKAITEAFYRVIKAIEDVIVGLLSYRRTSSGSGSSPKKSHKTPYVLTSFVHLG
ncbi:unnamed protein product [Cyprideis torosa]|uniref:Uncharacterized protein n=1 Tax=Cyprideis torosa TaxID=163714 RepID=A0A7R8ZTY2_9CRUS|nr:unnamed protein product [Cyprideis torosa]CAG0899181.1 unnamed protein product [Cyprideis torosa]